MCIRDRLLEELDRKKETGWLELLKAYFDNECSLVNTAKAMYVHRNTLVYRLGKLKELMHYDWDNTYSREYMKLSLIHILSDFAPVSIKMAKEQNLSLNPAKISGTCGRLMCCLKNEQETYEYLNKKLPNNGDVVIAPDGSKGEVQSVSVLRQMVKVMVNINDEKEIREYHVEELKVKQRHRKNKDKDREKLREQEKELTAEELKELKKLEKMKE